MATSTTDFDALLDRLRAGDDDAAWQLVSDYGPHIVAVVRHKLSRRLRVRLDSQDIVQAVWKSFFFDMAGIENIRSPQQLVAVLAGMTRNKVADAYRQHMGATPRATSREAEPLDKDDRRLPYEDDTPSQFAVAREQYRRMLSQRSPLEQEIIRRKVAGQTFEDIGASLDISERTARRVIEDLRQEHCHDEA